MAGLNLRRREKLVVLIGVPALALIVLAAVTRDFAQAYERSGRQLAQAKTRLREAQNVRMDIEAKRSGQEAIRKRIRKRSPRFNLWSFTQNRLQELSLEKRANLERKRTLGSLDRVQMTLKGVNMKELVDLLHAIYAEDDLVAIQSVGHFRPARDGKGLECQITFITPRS